MTPDGDVITTYETTKIAADSVGCSQSLIIMACGGRKKTAKGYKWKYEPISKEE
jgi:hypothetical protein